jgi:hypothetical protein
LATFGATGDEDLDPTGGRALVEHLDLEIVPVEIPPLFVHALEGLRDVRALFYGDERLRLVAGAQRRIGVEVVLPADGELVALHPWVVEQEILERAQRIRGLFEGGP